MAYTLDFTFLAPTGLSDLRAQLFDTTGSNTGSAISTGFVELGGGFYLWHYASFPDAHRGGVKFYSNAAPSDLLACGSINPEEAEYTDAKISTRLASASYTAPDNATITSIQADTDNIQTRLPAALVGGRIDASVGAMAANTITAIAIATDAIDADALSADAVTEIQTSVVAAIMAYAIESGHTLETILEALYAVIRGKAVANDAENPTQIIYYAPDNTTARVTHTLTALTRTP